MSDQLDLVDLAAMFKNDTSQPVRCEKITGDASTRRYFRVFFDDGQTLVLMVIGDRGSDEAHRFLRIQQFLLNRGIPVPAIYGFHPEACMISLQDLGCNHLEDAVTVSDIRTTRRLYCEAVELITKLRRDSEPHHEECGHFNPPFDLTKFMEEFAFFVTHYIGNLPGNRASTTSIKTLSQLFEAICNEIDFDHSILCHRDYHSRNIMLHEGRLVVIDFQDARLGPVQYDLASLLCDSYVTLPEDVIDDLLEMYYGQLDRSQYGSLHHFRYLFDVVSLQRNIKALGTFGYQIYVKNASRYTTAIPRTCRYIRSNIRKYSRFQPFVSVVEDLVCAPGLSIQSEDGA